MWVRQTIFDQLIPAYKPLICRTKQATTTIKMIQLFEDASLALQDCFECTDWGVFKDCQDISELETVAGQPSEALSQSPNTAYR